MKVTEVVWLGATKLVIGYREKAIIHAIWTRSPYAKFFFVDDSKSLARLRRKFLVQSDSVNLTSLGDELARRFFGVPK